MRATVTLSGEQAAPLIDAAQGSGVPGLAIALVAPGRKALLLHGKTQAGGGRSVDGSTWFSTASLGKHVTAAAVLALVQRGVLNLSAPIGQYLADTPAAWADRSVLSLLRHTSGLPEYLTQSPSDLVPTGRRDFLRRYSVLAPAFPEGAAWMYTNTNYILAGMLVAQLEGRSFAEALQAHFDRLGCQGVTVGSPQWARESNHAPASGGAVAWDRDSASREVIGDGDVCFTPAGALCWLEALLDGRLLDPRRTRLMFADNPLTTGRPAQYGCGWFLEPMADGVLAHHGGHFDGWTAMAIMNPARGSGVLAMCNLAPGHTRAVRHLAQTALETFAPGSTPLSLPAAQDESPGLTDRIRAQLIREPGSTVDARDLADELRLVAEHGSAVRTVPNLFCGVQPDRFELLQRVSYPTHQWHRYRLRYADRVEHVLVGTAPDGRIFWAWPL